MFSAWHVPAMWQFRMGGQAPTSYNGGIWPLVPWGFCSAASRPDLAEAGESPDFLLLGSCPAKIRSALEKEAALIIKEIARPIETPAEVVGAPST
jgi:hypothetical protein